MNSPLHITILINAACMGGGWKPDPDATAQTEFAEAMKEDGLLQFDHTAGAYRATSRGKAHLDALCEVPLPVWRTPWERMTPAAP